MNASPFYKILISLCFLLCLSCGENNLIGERYMEMPELKGRVLDADTGAPLRNALVTVYWFERRDGTLHGGPGFSLVNLSEAYADDEGFFYFNNWHYLRQGSWIKPEVKVDLSLSADGYGLQTKYDVSRFEAGYFAGNYSSADDGFINVVIRRKDIRSGSQLIHSDAYVRLIYILATQKSCLLLNVSNTIRNFNSLVDMHGNGITRYPEAIREDGLAYLDGCK